MRDNQKNTLLIDPSLNEMRESIDFRPVHLLFEQQVVRTPAGIAVVCEETKLTYRELNGYADQLSSQLSSMGVASGNFVPVVMYKGINMLISMLAILKAGAAYVPVDPDWPVERIKYVLGDVNGPCILVDPATKAAADGLGLLVDYRSMEPGTDEPLPASSSASTADETLLMESAMYAIYTSGSTGKPKGAIVPHRGIVNRLQWMTETLGSEAAHTTLQLSNPTFDSSVWQFFWPLMHGGKTVIPSPTMEKTADNILRLVYDHRLLIIHFVPSLLDYITEQMHLDRAIQAYLRSVKYVWVGGEKLSPKTVSAFRAMFPNILMSNHYGPTETSIACLYYPIEELPEGDIPIGKPIKNVRVVLLDELGRKVPEGQTGEIHIGGIGVGLGYLHDNEKSAKAFIPNPFPELGCNTLYKTGDLGRVQPDGTIAFLGRLDFQVKIRGFRVELSEIESVLASYPGVRQAVVLAHADEQGDTVLTAFYRAEQRITGNELREYLMRFLPDYMVPHNCCFLESFPLLTNGKINLQALLNMPLETEEEPAAALVTETERALAEIWKSVLGVCAIGRNSHFFDLGGQSLKAARCTMLINKEFGIKLKIAHLFDCPTLEQLARYMDSQSMESGNRYQNIPKTDKRDRYPVTSAQKRLYILNHTQGSQTSYNIPGFFIIEGELDTSRLEIALGELVARHETLRTSYHWNDNEPVQIVHPSIDMKLELLSLEGKSAQEAAASFVRPFDLTNAPLIRAGLASLDTVPTSSHLFLFDVHHIAADAISVSILLQELFMIYHGEKPKSNAVSYTDYAVWQQANESQWLENEPYWLEQYSDMAESAGLPHDFPRPAEQQYGSDRVKHYLSTEQNKRLEQWCSESGTTKYMVLLAVFSILQMQYSKQEDIIVGTPMAGREHPDTESLVGMFVHTLAIRTLPANHLTFRSFLMDVKRKVLGALDRQDYPFERLIEKLQIVREQGRNPLFDTMFVLQNMDLREAMLVSQGMHVTEQRIYDWTLRPFAYEHHAAKFDLMLEAVERNNVIGLKFDYSTSLFRRETIELFAEGFIHLLDQFLSNPDALLGETSCVNDRNRSMLLKEFNDTEAEYPSRQTLDRIFDEQAERYPDRLAVRCGEESLTYVQLHKRTEQIAYLLRSDGIQTGEVVGVMTERSIDMLAGILGILKAGAAYMPIDPAFPESRIDYMLENSGASRILAHRSMKDKLMNRHRDRLKIYAMDELPHSEAVSLPAAVHGPKDLAYVIYTSGTTGQPKGVMIEHHSVLNRIHWLQKEYPIGPEDVVLQKTIFTFDVSVWELFWWMFAGASVSLLAPGGEKDPKQICQTVKEHKVSALHFVPSMISLFLEYVERSDMASYLSTLRYVFVSGEALPRRHVQRFHALPAVTAKLVNVYGPTEATVDVTYYLCERNNDTGPVPIGKPIDNIQIYILDERLTPVPVGVSGNLWISGVGVARGYLNNPSLTAEKFVPCPFDPAQLMYKSGDIARWLPGGYIEYLGRSDHQIKIRGYRIEADEIVHHSLKFPGVQGAIVQARGEQEDKRLCLYLVADNEVSEAAIRDHLTGVLPSYMVPDFVIQLDKIPLSLNGKVDVKQLPEPKASTAASKSEEPAEAQDELEINLHGIWKQLLRNENIGLDDDFFRLGGNSLLAIKLELEVEEMGYPIDNIGVFRYRTIRSYANHIRTQLM